MSTTIAAIATPACAGGIGIVRLSGEQATDIADKVFKSVSGKNLSQMKGYTALFGKVYDNDELLDECVALVFKSPKSYTGEDVVELSCHGGLYVMQRVLRAVLNNGAVAAAAGEFTKRAFLNGKLDLTKAEAVMNVVSAHGKQALCAAVNTLSGRLGDKIRGITNKLSHTSAAIAVWTDDPDEDVPDAHEENIISVLETCKAELLQLTQDFDNGMVFTEGVLTAIVGRPNVGKSTLMNLLSGFDRSIVTPIAGTTRDIVEETVVLGDIKLRLADTAGLHQSDDLVEAIGIEKSKSKMENAQLVIAVFDGSQKLNEDDMALLQSCKGKKAIAVINKSDLECVTDSGVIEEYIKNHVYISAKDGSGTRELQNAIEAALGASDIDTSSGILSNERQYYCCKEAQNAISEALECLLSGVTLDAANVCIDTAISSLLELTGEKARDAVVSEIFSKFCVGK